MTEEARKFIDSMNGTPESDKEWQKEHDEYCRERIRRLYRLREMEILKGDKINENTN